MSVYSGIPLKQKLRQWHLLHTHVWWNKLRHRYDAAYIRKTDNKFSYSKWPHELVTLDFDENDNLIGVEVIGTNLRVTLS